MTTGSSAADGRHPSAYHACPTQARFANSPAHPQLVSSAKTRQVRRMAGRLAVVTVPSAARAASIFSEEVGDGVDGSEAEVAGRPIPIDS
ncbi:hypothetical protein ACFVZA_10540 [Streptomyces bottropensis]|uniref:hypothetical protein n=1 Tax=Streptomyces bottropensis TaxID=42235 RepID=UPI0036900438